MNIYTESEEEQVEEEFTKENNFTKNERISGRSVKTF